MFDSKNPARYDGRQQQTESSAGENAEAMQVPVVTQTVPGDAFDDDSPMVATHGDEAPTQRELEQDVAMTNPSVESMQGRG